MTDLEFLESIRDRLLQKGWLFGQMGSAEGPNCLLGAAMYEHEDINAITHNGIFILTTSFAAKTASGKRLARLLGLEPEQVPTFNDGHRRSGRLSPDGVPIYDRIPNFQTGQHVFDLLESAIEYQRSLLVPEIEETEKELVCS